MVSVKLAVQVSFLAFWGFTEALNPDRYYGDALMQKRQTPASDYSPAPQNATPSLNSSGLSDCDCRSSNSSSGNDFFLGLLHFLELIGSAKNSSQDNFGLRLREALSKLWGNETSLGEDASLNATSMVGGANSTGYSSGDNTASPSIASPVAGAPETNITQPNPGYAPVSNENSGGENPQAADGSSYKRNKRGENSGSVASSEATGTEE